MPLTQQGQWNIGGFNLPDSGLSELFTGKNSSWSNPNVVQKGTYLAPTNYGTPNNTTGPEQGPVYYGPQNTLGLMDSPRGGRRSNLQQQQQNDNNQTQSWEDAARSQYDADVSAENSSFDYNRDQLLSQLGSLGGQRDLATKSLDDQLGGVRSTIGNQKTLAQQNTESQIGRAGDTAHNVQKQNRNVLRALGILNSSAAGELLSKPMNQFDQQRGDLNLQLQNRNAELDNFLNERITEHQNAYQGVIQQFNDLTGKIQTDLRFNDRQRLDAIRGANAALKSRITEIQSSAQQFQQQVNLQRQQISNGMNSMQEFNPLADLGQIQQTAQTTGTGPNALGLNIYDEQRKKQEQQYGGGLLSGLA